ncbi:hypothetical protein Nepgr_010160 [Nepenthes gracilis]|uniref:Uncharacterized protein n=1 Tax=Nepenthes gracilis TaxID=150966 RepID=A0AAD3SCK6_NEPGR|nr:hypothetical protein Nepgr_010160 [Nepenthes gracilis]
MAIFAVASLNNWNIRGQVSIEEYGVLLQHELTTKPWWGQSDYNSYLIYCRTEVEVHFESNVQVQQGICFLRH